MYPLSPLHSHQLSHTKIISLLWGLEGGSRTPYVLFWAISELSQEYVLLGHGLSLTTEVENSWANQFLLSHWFESKAEVAKADKAQLEHGCWNGQKQHALMINRHVLNNYFPMLILTILSLILEVVGTLPFSFLSFSRCLIVLLSPFYPYGQISYWGSV